MMRLAGENLNNVSFLSQGGFITSLFLGVPQGWAVVPGLFGSVFISLSVLVSVIQVSARATRSPLCTPAHPLGPPCSTSRGVAVIRACVLPHLSHPTHCSVVATSVGSRTCVLYKACTADTTIPQAYLSCPRRAVLPFTPETTRPNGLGGWIGSQVPFPSAVPYLNN